MDPPAPIGKSVGRARGRSARPALSSSSAMSVCETRPGSSIASMPTSSGITRPSSVASMATASTTGYGPQGDRARYQQREERVRTRPTTLTDKKGKSGTSVMLYGNYFKLASVTDWTLFQYHVDFQPEEDRTVVKRKLLTQHKSMLGGFIFDGMIMYTSERLESPMTFVSTKEDSETKVVITVTFTREIAPGDHEYLQFFNILMRKCLAALNLKLVGRNFFDPNPKVKIALTEHKLELWPGYITSIRQHENDILLCTEITHKVMRTDSVFDVLDKCGQQGGDIKREFKAAIIGVVVLTDYNNKTYRVDDVDFDATPLSTFARKDGSKISYRDYYLQRYNIRITNNQQPLLVTKSKAKDLRAGLPETVYLIPELCRMTGIDDNMRSNYRLMSAMAVHTRVNPQMRIQRLLNFSRRLREEPEIVNELDSWKMKVNESLVSFPGRVLPTENILQGSQGREIKYKAPDGLDWTRNANSNEMFATEALSDWIVIFPAKMEQSTSNFIRIVQECANKMGMQIRDPITMRLPDDKHSTYVNRLETELSRYNPQIVICCVPNNRGDRYGAIKKKLCVDRAVPSQVLTDKAMNAKGIRSVAAKVAIQINCKIGGSPWVVEIPLKSVMIVGFDASHDTMHKGLSYGAMVATINNTFSRYFSTVSAHKSGEELSNQISLNLVKALQTYANLNHELPNRIIMYRDGVGDGQIPYVYKHEIGLIKEKLDELYGAKPWHLAFIVVSKRINTRILDASHQRNPDPGTVVDDCITLPDRYDFFLVSQSVRQGTVSPTSYNVIYDNSNLDPDKLQRLTYKLCHLYYNWSGTVRVPAPVQYAHKLAQLVGQHLHRTPAAGMDDLLYFL